MRISDWSSDVCSSDLTRLETFRLLVRHEPEGLAAGDIARSLDVPQNTMSAHLAILARAGLVRSERHSRSIIYRAELECLRTMMLFLVKDCCGRSEENTSELQSLMRNSYAALCSNKKKNISSYNLTD